ncbi:SIR2 family protein [Teredinibacter purpureus]|uniref:SIR2 family protein n=1 Tax=Teredinibacter purpureus TaxID=2731756 RepID=UPI000A9C6652|nr:SIR2 family protein [Teredinibacter purpureus]
MAGNEIINISLWITDCGLCFSTGSLAPIQISPFNKDVYNLTQYLKLGDDQSPVQLDAHGDNGAFKVVGDCVWAKAEDEITPDFIRSRVEPWLTALFQSEHLNLLVGAGLSAAVQESATGQPPQGMGWIEDLKICRSEINAHVEKAATAAGRNKGNIEDQIRSLNELIKGIEVLTALDRPNQKLLDGLEQLQKELSRALKEFSRSISHGENLIRNSDSDLKTETFNYLVNFLMSFSSRTATRDRLHIFTTNYDRILETGAEIAGLRLVDRFVGSIAPIFRSSRLEVDYHYNPPGIRGEPRYLEGVARFTKLHGSLDWYANEGAIRRFGLPFGAASVEPFLQVEGAGTANYQQLMIYPNSVKDRETSEYPYVELFRDLASATCRPNSTLVTYGYSFGDEHINRVLTDMLTIPSTHIVIIAYADPLGRIMSFIKDSGRQAQISLLLGDHLGGLKTLVDYYLPKAAIDRTSIRMAELLKSRGLYPAAIQSTIGDEE